MSDTARELVDVKREVVEARNQAIKTDNQVKNLTLDIKNFEKRFDSLEGRVRLSGIGVNILVALVIVVAAYIVASARMRSFEAEISVLKQAVSDEHKAAQARLAELSNKLSIEAQHRELSQKARGVAGHILDLAEQNQEMQAADHTGELDDQQLSELERRLLRKRFHDLRVRQAEVSFKAARRSFLAGRAADAVPELMRVLHLDGEGRLAAPAKMLLAQALWWKKNYAEAEPLLRNLVQSEDRQTKEDAEYLLATALARLNKLQEARTRLSRVIEADDRYAASAKAYLLALQEGGELPQDLAGGRVRLKRRVGGPATPPLTQQN